MPDGYRHMDGFGAHTFKLVNAQGEAVYCKFHWKVRLKNTLFSHLCFQTQQGNKWLPAKKAQELCGIDPDYATRDLYNAIANGNYPEWKLFIQANNRCEARQKHHFSGDDHGGSGTL